MREKRNFSLYFRGGIRILNRLNWPTGHRRVMPRGVPVRPALATSPSLAHHVAPLIEKSRALPSCPLHSPPSCSLALVLSPAALGPRSAGAPWLPRQSHAPSTLAARHLQPSEHPAPRPSSASSRRPLASEALESLATAAMAVCRSRAPWPSSFFHSEHPSQHHHHLHVFA